MTAAGRLERVRETPVRFTAEEFMALATRPPLADVPGKLELVDGRIVRMSPANTRHWLMQQQINRRLDALYVAAPGNWIVGTEATVRLGPRKVRLPDISVLRDPDLSETIFTVSALFLAVEVSDTTRRIDLGPKRRDYARAGVPHYWVADLNDRVVHVMGAPEGDGYRTAEVLPFGAPIAAPGVDGAIVID